MRVLLMLVLFDEFGEVYDFEVAFASWASFLDFAAFAPILSGAPQWQQ